MRIDSKEQLEAYLSGDKIECLICGKKYKMLGIHVSQTHKMPTEEYKKKFNIPLTRALSTKADLEKRSAQTKSRHEKGELSIEKAISVRRNLIESGKYVQKFNMPDYALKDRSNQIRKSHKGKVFTDHSYKEFLNRLKTRSLKDVTKDDDMPSEITLMNYLNTNKKLKARYKSIVKDRRGLSLNNKNYKNKLRNKHEVND